MDARDLANEMTVSQRGRRSWRGRTTGAAAVALAGALALGAASAPIAAASTHHSSNSKNKKKTVNPLAAPEKQLSSLEANPGGGSLTETGSSLFYPLLSTWAQSYHGASVQTASTGSGTGQSEALNGTVNIGASDAYLPLSDPPNLLDIPIVVSAQQVDYNIPGLAKGVHLKLTPKILNAIYTGQITTWNDPAITSVNKGVSIPNVKIVPLRRSDSSGDTFLFSSYLYNALGSSSFVTNGPNTVVSWPNVSGELGEKGNSGMLATCETTAGCVAYIGISYLRSALKNGLGDAQLLNGKGNYVLPTPQNILSEVASYQHIPSTGAVNLEFSKTAKFGYPIVNFEYAIVNANQSSSTTATAIKAFLAWGMDPRHGAAASFLAPVNFQPLAANAMSVAVSLLNKIQ
jgi:phosphate transport system substrate-binding protein